LIWNAFVDVLKWDETVSSHVLQVARAAWLLGESEMCGRSERVREQRATQTLSAGALGGKRAPLDLSP